MECSSTGYAPFFIFTFLIEVPSAQDDNVRNRNYRKYLRTELHKKRNEVVSFNDRLKLLSPKED